MKINWVKKKGDNYFWPIIFPIVFFFILVITSFIRSYFYKNVSLSNVIEENIIVNEEVFNVEEQEQEEIVNVEEQEQEEIVNVEEQEQEEIVNVEEQGIANRNFVILLEIERRTNILRRVVERVYTLTGNNLGPSMLDYWLIPKLEMLNAWLMSIFIHFLNSSISRFLLFSLYVIFSFEVFFFRFEALGYFGLIRNILVKLFLFLTTFYFFFYFDAEIFLSFSLSFNFIFTLISFLINNPEVHTSVYSWLESLSSF